MDNFIKVYNNALTDEFCDAAVKEIDKYIERSENFTKFVEHVRNDDDNARTDISIFPGHFESSQWLVDEIRISLNKYYNEFCNEYTIGTKFEDAYRDLPKLQKSSSGGGFVQWHCEQGSGASSSRFLVWMYYLNDVEKGGKTEFLYQDLQFKPTKGQLLIWPAAFTHTHRAAKDLEEDKYIATGWFHYPVEKKLPENSFSS